MTADPPRPAAVEVEDFRPGLPRPAVPEPPGPPARPWESWAPPLSPPAEAGLPVEEAEGIAAAWWECEPHLAAALMWESYAATLPPELPVSMITTGSQSVAYGQATPCGELGLALARAQWHRSFTGAGSVPVRVARRP